MTPGGKGLPLPVWPATCAQPGDGAPLALGMVVSAIGSLVPGDTLRGLEISPIRLTSHESIDDVRLAERPGLLLTSNYLWTLDQNLALAREVKELQPDSITVFGGPSAPKYEQEADAFLRDHPEVDVLVRGEGEQTVAELAARLCESWCVEALEDVGGLTFRSGRRVVRTPERVRLADLNVIESPYLAGLFDHLVDHPGIWAIETNRGCPYGCTFCDWGAATLSRVRRFDTDRVRSEAEWMARHGINSVFVCDANFGIFDADIGFAEWVAELHRRHGAPRSIIATFAKNTTRRTVPIVRILADAGLICEATTSFQTTDPVTLSNIRRSNISLEAYEDLTEAAQALDLPVLADIMIGLPGSTIETLKSDLQHCIEREVTARTLPTFLLPNSPMNDPEYRHRFDIQVDGVGQLVATTTYSRADREAMMRLCDIFRIADHFGALRHVIRFVGREQGRREIDVLVDLVDAVDRAPDDYPTLSFGLSGMRRYLLPPLGWPAWFEEVRHLLTGRLGVVDDDALDTVLRVQEALLPAPGRRFPCSVPMAHDYVAYFKGVLRPGLFGRPDIEGRSRLADFGPGVIDVDDPGGVCESAFRLPTAPRRTLEGDRDFRDQGDWTDGTNWELESPIRRAIRTGGY